MLPTPNTIILTHEHTDFDALASLLGAALLFPGATPILPRQLNRNVTSFLTLYKNQLPFVAVEDAPHGHIKQVILVDTRSASPPRGVRKGASYLIIDHHANHATEKPDKPLSKDSQIWSEPVGANTTLLVERLIAQQTPPTPLHATLLALGIHEDTGSLTYASTTTRDARCLAWLMECGANLSELRHFLQHPLSDAQRTQLEQLIAHSEMVEIDGNSVVIAQAEAQGFQDEISALAGRLRDFYETDAIFLLVAIGDIVQVVARSTSDAVDVGAVARQLGGGGHRRAAAAPIHQATLSQVRSTILSTLKQQSRSGMTVGQIMSRGRPQILSPDLRIDAAATLMRRYGHEGFPVVEKLADDSERLLGVFTRREADRAISHGLHKEPVRRFMRAGNVTVRADDPISLLRQLMIEHDWGQVPVVDGQGEIIGIVTRTDLIKLWDEATLPERQAPDVTQRLRATLGAIPHHLLKLIGEQVAQRNQSVYVVGGFVRDLLLAPRTAKRSGVGNDQLDVDIVIEGDAIDFGNEMQRIFGGRLVVHRQFGTAKWILNDPQAPIATEHLLAALAPLDRNGTLPPALDFVTARTEFYTAPSVLPTVESSSIKLDLHRRDFTINTLALCLTPTRWGVLLDFYGGVNDLEKGLVRVLHSLSFVDDPTRMLRAVRYEQRFGFRIESRTLELLGDALDLLDRVTPARIRHELERIFQETVPELSLLRLSEIGVLQRLHPALQADGRVGELFGRLRGVLRGDVPVADWVRHHLAAQPLWRLFWVLWVNGLPGDVIEQLNERLGWDKATQRLLDKLQQVNLVADELRSANLPPSRATALLDVADLPALALLVVVNSADERLLPVVYRYHDEWRHVRPILSGDDLTQMGIVKGPIYSRILDALRNGRLDGVLVERRDEVRLVEQLHTVINL